MSTRVEVRCCCQPRRLLGTVEIPGEAVLGHPYHFEVRAGRHRLESFGGPITYDPPEYLTLELLQYVRGFHPSTGEVHYGVALRAEGAPLELLRRIPSFQEINDER